MKEVLLTTLLTVLLIVSVLWRARDYFQALSTGEWGISQVALEEVRNSYAKDEITIEDVEVESEFWLSVEACEFYDKNQMCSSHYTRFYGGY